jgi:hypothetical protein
VPRELVLCRAVHTVGRNPSAKPDAANSHFRIDKPFIRYVYVCVCMCVQVVACFLDCRERGPAGRGHLPPFYHIPHAPSCGSLSTKIST